MDGDEQQQRAKRIEINERFESVADFISQYATNISQTGCFIHTSDVLPHGSLVRLRFTVVTEQIHQIEGTGSVVRVSDDPPGIGIKFAYLTEDSRRFIDTLMEA